MLHRVRFGACLLLAICQVLTGWSWRPMPAQAQAGGLFAKIAPWVIEHTANGAQAEFLVVLADQADLSQAAAFPEKPDKGRVVRDALWKKAQASQQPLLAWLQARGVPHRSYYIVNLVWVQGDRALAEVLAARPDVARIEGNPRIQNVIPTPKINFDERQPGAPAAVEPNISYVHAPLVWAMGYTGQGIVIGGQDTGYDWTHPALKPHYRGWDGTTANHNYNWHDSIHTVGGGGACGHDSPVPCDDDQHGTHTMGTVVGAEDNGTNQIGMAPGARWMGCRNMDMGVGQPSTYLECFEFFLAPYPVGGTPAQGDPNKAPDVTNNSWGCPTSEGCSWNTLQAAVEAQRAAGIMTVVSAGNSGSSCSTVSDPPSFYAASYTVGALNTGTDTIASFSSRGPVTADGSNRRKPDITAPGTGIRSSIPGGYSSAFSGTSMAGPHVAGAVALLWSARPALKHQIAATEDALNDSAAHISSSLCSGGWPNNVYGYGRLDIKAAVDQAPVITGTLQGTITAAVGGTPIVGAQIQAAGLTTSDATSGAGGAYSLSLNAGTYTVTTTATGYVRSVISNVAIGANLTTTLNISLAVPTPDMTIQPPQVDVRLVHGSVDTQTLQVANPGTAPLNWEVAEVPAAGWLAEAPSNGVLPAGTSQDVAATFDVRSVAPGAYTTTLQFTGHVPETRIVAVPVTLTVVLACEPIAGLDYQISTLLPRIGRPVTFTAISTTGTAPITFAWNFGDGGTGSGQQVTHAFVPNPPVRKAYDIVLTTGNACSSNVKAQKTIVVQPYGSYLPLFRK